MPPAPVRTLATTAILATRLGVSNKLVDASVRAIYEDDIRAEVPTLYTAQEAFRWGAMPLHPKTRRYFDPYSVDILANFMESLAAGKELLFAFVAGLYLGWDRWRRMKERERDKDLRVLKNRLDTLLNETVRIERAQMSTSDPAELKGYLDEVTKVKLQALDELTHEDLRGDRMFHIFLTQCGNLINKIQVKITAAAIQR